MNKTVNANIGGVVFHIEENAYEQLRKYLDTINGFLKNTEGREEIMQDIESRIAEMFNEQLRTVRQVITAGDLEIVMKAMGRPEEVVGNDHEAETENPEMTGGTKKSYRRLYRDPDDKVVGGVCSGISHYIGVDPMWLRLAFAAAIFIWGTGFWLYVILLIILPKARTTAEKLEMKGQPVTVRSIKETIEEEVFDIKNRLAGEKSRSTRSTISNFFDALGAILIAGLKFFVSFIGAVVAVTVFALLIALFILLMGMAGWLPGSDIPLFLTGYFMHPLQLNASILALGILIGIPLLILLHKLAQRLFKLPRLPRGVVLGAISLFIFGFILAMFTGWGLVKDFRHEANLRTQLLIAQPLNDTLLVEATTHEDAKSGQTILISDNNLDMSLKGDSVLLNNVKLDIRRAAGDKFELVQINSAKGSNAETAEDRVREISYEFVQNNNSLQLPSCLMLPKKSLFRNQETRLILYVPEGKSVFLSEGTESIIHDIKNVTNTWDDDMPGHTWTMTPAGLECIGCGLPTLLETDIDAKDISIIIDEKETKQQSDEDSSNVEELKDLDINVGNGRIRIRTKEK